MVGWSVAAPRVGLAGRRPSSRMSPRQGRGARSGGPSPTPQPSGRAVYRRAAPQPQGCGSPGARRSGDARLPWPRAGPRSPQPWPEPPPRQGVRGLRLSPRTSPRAGRGRLHPHGPAPRDPPRCSTTSSAPWPSFEASLYPTDSGGGGVGGPGLRTGPASGRVGGNPHSHPGKAPAQLASRAGGGAEPKGLRGGCPAGQVSGPGPRPIRILGDPAGTQEAQGIRRRG